MGLVDAVLPKDMAKLAEQAGVDKAEQDGWRLFALAAMAGAYIAFGATFAATATAGFGELPAGFSNMLPTAPPGIDVVGFFSVLTPVTVGNIIGGGAIVAMAYWFVYLRPFRRED